MDCGAAADQPRDDGATALYQACSDSHADLVAILLAAGAQVEQVNPAGMTPLWAACSCQDEQPALVRMLLVAAANPLKRVLGWSALDLARVQRRDATLLLLTEYVPEGSLAEPEPRWLREAQALLGLPLTLTLTTDPNPQSNPNPTLTPTLTLIRCAHLTPLHPAADLLQPIQGRQSGRGVVGIADGDAAHAAGRRRAHGLAGPGV